MQVIRGLKWPWGIQGPVTRDDPEFHNYNNEMGECFWYLMNYNCSLKWWSLHVVFLGLRRPPVFGVHFWPGSKYSDVSHLELGSTEGLFNSDLTLKITVFPMDFWTLKVGLQGSPETSVRIYCCSLHNTPEERSSQQLLIW